MLDSNIISLFKLRYKALSIDGQGDNYSKIVGGLTLGLVVNTDDPTEGGRLQVFCPALNDDPKKIMHLPWAVYITPFGGSINNFNYARGVGDGNAHSEGAVHYGFWGIPELGAHVLVGCVDGDPRRRFFIGSVPEHQETHTQFNGRFDWAAANGTPDGPLTSSKKPIQPIYDNWTKAFVDRATPEWKTRGADYQVSINTKDGNGTPSRIRGEDYLDESFEGMSAHEKDELVREILGANGYDWSGFKSVGPFKSSRVFGMSTPGFHSFAMDDRAFNSRIKLRTATGHQILLDDTNERIYVMTNKGNSWMEMDSSGNVDVFSDRRISLSASKDINISAGGTVRIHGERGVYIYAGHTDGETAQSLENPPIDGEVRIQSVVDMHLLANNLRFKSHQNTYNETGINRYDVVNGSTFLDVVHDINVRTLEGDYIKSITGNLAETVMLDSKRMSLGTTAFTSQGNAEIYSFNGTLDIGSQGDATLKSAQGNLDLEAMGQNTDAGNIRINSPRSQVMIGDNGIEGLTSKSTNFKAAENIELEISQTTAASKSGGVGATIVNIDGLLDVSDCDIGEQTPVTDYSADTPMSVDDVAKVCYNAGFRGDDLIIAVALAKGESGYRPNPTPPANPDTTGKWGPAVGLFQIRTLNDCSPYEGTVDGLRNNTNGQLEDPNVNARVAYQIFTKCNPPNEWTVGKWESFKSDRIDSHFTQFVESATEAVANLCGVPMMMPNPLAVSYENVEVEPVGAVLEDEMLLGVTSPAAGTVLLMSAANMTLQSATDINFKAIAGAHYNAYSEIVTKLDSNIIQTDMLAYYTAILTTAVDTLAGAVGESFSLPLSIDIGSLIGSIYSGGFPSALTALAGDLASLNTMISGLGGLGLSLPLTMENIVSQLEGNAFALSGLGLPTNMSFPFNPASIGSLDIVAELSAAINATDIEMLEIPPFRPLVDKIFQNATYPVGDVDLSDMDWDSFGGIFDVV